MPRYEDMASILTGGNATATMPFWGDYYDQAQEMTEATQIPMGVQQAMINQGYSWADEEIGYLTEMTDLGFNLTNIIPGESHAMWGDDPYQYIFDEPAISGGGGYIQQPQSPSGPTQDPIEWILGDYDVGGQGPDWWRPFTVKNAEHFGNPMVSATLMMNALIGSGSLSDEDARSMAKQLYATWGGQTADNPWDLYSTKFGEREDMFGSPTMQGTFDPFISQEQALLGQTGPGVIDAEARFSRGRSEQALNALSMMREATVGGNVHEFGPGYQYLQEVAGTLGEAGTADTRATREQILGALDPMMAMSQGGELAGFSQMAQALASPFYTNLPPEVSRTQAGDYQFGRQSKHLFF